jgi:hypothetical protein
MIPLQVTAVSAPQCLHQSRIPQRVGTLSAVYRVHPTGVPTNAGRQNSLKSMLKSLRHCRHIGHGHQLGQKLEDQVAVQSMERVICMIRHDLYYYIPNIERRVDGRMSPLRLSKLSATNA